VLLESREPHEPELHARDVVHRGVREVRELLQGQSDVVEESE
jgi:hypothetical protein